MTTADFIAVLAALKASFPEAPISAAILFLIYRDFNRERRLANVEAALGFERRARAQLTSMLLTLRDDVRSVLATIRRDEKPSEALLNRLDKATQLPSP